MPYNPNIHHRKSIRLKGYDYAQAGLYFITIVTQNRECLFGEIMDGEMILNDAGQMIETEWTKIKNRFPNIEIHGYITMPNHFHAIIEIVDITVGATLVVALNDNGETTIDNGATQNDNRATTIDNRATTRVAPTITIDDWAIPNDNRATTRVAPTTTIDNGATKNDNRATTRVAPTITIDDGATTIDNGATTRVAPTGKTIGDIMDAFKSITTVEYIRGVKTLNWQPFNGKLWQRNYWEHIIRNQDEYQRITEYIINNPQNWENDKLKS